VTAPERSATSEPLIRVVIGPAHGRVALEHVVGDAGATGLGEELGAEADEATRRDEELHPDPAGAVVGHLFHAALAGGHELGDGAEELLGGVDGEALDRLVHLAVDLLGDDLRLADGQLEAFAAHLLDEDGERELATPLDLPGVRAVGVEDPDRDVADELAVDAVLDQRGGDLGARARPARASCWCRWSSRWPARRR
jgi:hypothetical protein